MFVDLSIEIREGMVFRKGSPPFALEDIRCLNENINSDSYRYSY